MAKRGDSLSTERLRALLRYNAETGRFWWLVDRGPTKAGTDAGTKITPRNRYVVIYVLGVPYKAHRLAWLYCYGRWPNEEIDHIDGDRLNNRLNNLREATRTSNTQNLRGPRKDNSVGLLGVSRYGRKFKAQIQVNKKKMHIGYFDTALQAYAAYMAAKERLHGLTLSCEAKSGSTYGEAKR